MALKPAQAYVIAALAREQVPPTSSQAKFYLGIAELVLSILADADVSPTLGVPPMSNSGGPVTGLGKIV